MTSAVVITRCADYQDDRVYQAVKRSLDSLGGLAKIIRPGDRVLLKVNMLMASEPEDAVTTHPAIIKAVGGLVREAGGKPVVGDSPGNAYANIDKALERTGIRAAAESCGAEIVNFEKSGLVEIDYPQGENFRKLYLAQAVLDCDVIITMPKLKTHNYVLYTGAIKNMFGAVTGFNKANYHLDAPHPGDFCRVLVDIYEQARPSLAIMDAVWAMEGAGPASGRRRDVGLILSSYDPVALDAVAGKIIGYEPDEIMTTSIAAARGLGEKDLENIEILDTPLAEALIPDYWKVRRGFNILSGLPRFMRPSIRYLIEKTIKIYPEVVREECVKCGVCKNNCPSDALGFVDGYPKIDFNRCLKCYCCHELCPEHAFTIKRSLLARLLGIGTQS